MRASRQAAQVHRTRHHPVCPGVQFPLEGQAARCRHVVASGESDRRRCAPSHRWWPAGDRRIRWCCIRNRHEGDFVIAAGLNRRVPWNPIERNHARGEHTRERRRRAGKQKSFRSTASDRCTVPIRNLKRPRRSARYTGKLDDIGVVAGPEINGRGRTERQRTHSTRPHRAFGEAVQIQRPTCESEPRGIVDVVANSGKTQSPTAVHLDGSRPTERTDCPGDRGALVNRHRSHKRVVAGESQGSSAVLQESSPVRQLRRDGGIPRALNRQRSAIEIDAHPDPAENEIAVVCRKGRVVPQLKLEIQRLRDRAVVSDSAAGGVGPVEIDGVARIASQRVSRIAAAKALP